MRAIDFAIPSKEHLHDRINELFYYISHMNFISQWIIWKIKSNRNDGSYRVDESIVDFNIDQFWIL